MNNVIDMIKRNVNTKNIKLQFRVIYISLLHQLRSHVDHLFYSFQLLSHHIINKSELQLDGIAKVATLLGVRTCHTLIFKSSKKLLNGLEWSKYSCFKTYRSV